MISMKQLVGGFVMVGALASAACAVERPVFKKMDQPVAWFKSDGGKYPWIMTYYPGLERVTNVLCGTNSKGTPKSIATSADLAALQPLCCWTKYSESNIQLEKFYKGYREAYLARGAERLLAALGFTPNDTYKGTLLVDEYVNGMPQKWVLRTEDVEHIVVYLSSKFADANIMPLATKPVLQLELVEANGVISTEAEAFLNTYYDVVDKTDLEASTFFTNADKRKNDCFAATIAAHTVGSTVGESILTKTVDQIEKVELKKVAVVVAGLIAAGLAKKVFIEGSVDVLKKPSKTMLIIGGSLVALLIIPAIMEYIEDIKSQAAQEKLADSSKKQASETEQTSGPVVSVPAVVA